MEKRLYRSRNERMISGVCGGLALYFNTDPTIVRLIFILTIPFGGIGIIAYIILSLVVPLENSQTTEPKDTIRENVQEIKETAETIGKDIKSTFDTSSENRETSKYYRPPNSILIIGIVILAVGIIALLFTVGPLHVVWWFRWDYLWPILLIAIGLLIIFARRR
jgi:phage shock protein C